MKARRAKDIMTTDIVTVREGTPITEAMELLVKHNIGCLPVVDADGCLVGVLTAYDILDCAVSGEAESVTVGQEMSRNIFSFSPEDDLETIVNGCLSKRVHRIPIVADDKLVGLISRRDIMREIVDIYGGK